MSSKHRRRPDASRADSISTLREVIDRLFVRGHFKDAVKQAKIFHKQQPSEESHRLLERSYFERLRQLQQGGMINSAREVAQHLLDFGLTDSDLVEPLAEILLAIGMSGRGLALQQKLETPEARDRLARQAADQAVLQPDQTTVPADLREAARKVRQALETLQTGDESSALEALKDVARSSPFSDWKRFVRGLAAYRQGEPDAARAHWEPLDPARAPARIAESLQTLDRPPSETGAVDPAVERSLEPLERWTFQEPVLRPLRNLGSLMAEDRWADAVKLIGPLRATLRRIDPDLAVRLTQTLYMPVIHSATQFAYREGQTLLRNFTRSAEPMPLDPRWNRLWALTWEYAGGPDEALAHWKAYLEDLKTTNALKPDERVRAQALVWLHLGRERIELADEVGRSGPAADREVRRDRREAEQFLEESLRLDPTSQGAYQALVSAYQAWDEPEKAAALARRRHQAVPDDFNALILLAGHHFDRNEPAESLSYALKARTLKPLDDQAALAEWAARVALARHLARSAQFDSGLAELDTADRLRPDLAQSVLGQARRVAFLFKAGRTDEAEALLADAQGPLVEPTPLWLALRIEASRYDLPKADQQRFEALWTEALPKRVRHQTAGALADLVGSFLASRIDYPERQTHVHQVLDYLGRTTRIKYARQELRQACAFLEALTAGLNEQKATPTRGSRRGPKPISAQVQQARSLYEKLAKRGTTLFPDSPEFPMLLGAMEVEKGPYEGDLRKARRLYEKAQTLAKAQEATDPEATRTLARLQSLMTNLEDLESSPFGPSFGLPGRMPPGIPPGIPRELYDIINQVLGSEDDFDDDEDWDDEEAFVPGLPLFPFDLPPEPRPKRPKPKRGPRAKKKKRK